MFNIGCSRNIKEFFNDNLAYKNRITYSPTALGYLANFKKISDQINFEERRSISSKASKKKNSVLEIKKTRDVEDKEIPLDASSLSSNSLKKTDSSLISQEK
jgi:hypothetical protein